MPRYWVSPALLTHACRPGPHCSPAWLTVFAGPPRRWRSWGCASMGPARGSATGVPCRYSAHSRYPLGRQITRRRPLCPAPPARALFHRRGFGLFGSDQLQRLRLCSALGARAGRPRRWLRLAAVPRLVPRCSAPRFFAAARAFRGAEGLSTALSALWCVNTKWPTPPSPNCGLF
jgi:hypothetical protein